MVSYIFTLQQNPKIVDKIAEITGAEVVNGFETSVPEEEIMAVIIDCGGTLRCGIYPKKVYLQLILWLLAKVVH